MDPALERLLRRAALDRTVAAIARELGADAESIGVTRPSYACLRRHIAAEKIRRTERDAAIATAAALALTRSVVPTWEGIGADYRRGVRRTAQPVVACVEVTQAKVERSPRARMVGPVGSAAGALLPVDVRYSPYFERNARADGVSVRAETFVE